jgi:hypothetical protein
VSDRVSLCDVLGHFEGRTDPRWAPGFESYELAVRGARVLDVVRRFEQTESGPLVLGVLRTFHDPQWAKEVAAVYGSGARKACPSKEAFRLRVQLRGLAEVYAWICELDEVACYPAKRLADAWACGQELESRAQAAETYTDKLLELDRWLEVHG